MSSTFGRHIRLLAALLPLTLALAAPAFAAEGEMRWALHVTLAAKWLDLLKQMVPSLARVALMFNPDTSPQSELNLRSIAAAAPALGVEAMAAPVHSTADIEHAIDEVAREPNCGLIPLPGPLMAVRRDLIISLASRYRLPSVYAYRYYPTSGGLASYGVEIIDLYRRAASYVDRILKGEKPGDLPVQQATKFALVINLKTAKAIGVKISDNLLSLADEVIE